MSENISESALPCPDNIMRIKDYFKERDVFITGGSGFMGKVLVEKLLWSCQDVGNIYLLLRDKKGHSARERLENLLNLEMFSRLKGRNKDVFKKLIPVSGDLLENNLGLSEEDTEMLQNNVSVVFHAAADVRFNDPLDKVILNNVRGTRDILHLSQCMKKMSAFVHVSTAYANTHQQYIDETLHTSHADWRTFIKIAETLNPTELNILEDKILGHHLNSYTFSKYLSESLVHEYRKKIPVIILRPSVVLMCLKEPLAGWIDNFSGVIALWLGYLTGVLHVLYTTNTNKLDHIPCDYAINALIMTACYRGNTRTEKCAVINAGSGEKNKISFRFLFGVAKIAVNKYPPNKMLWYPTFKIIDNYSLYMILFYLWHILPGIFFEIVLKLKGINFSILMIYRKIFAMHKNLIFFTNNEFKIISKNYFSLPYYVHPDDKDEFPVDMHAVDDIEATFIAIKGFKKYLLKEKIDEESLAKARKKFTRMFFASVVLKFGFVFMMMYLMLAAFDTYFPGSTFSFLL